MQVINDDNISPIVFRLALHSFTRPHIACTIAKNMLHVLSVEDNNMNPLLAKKNLAFKLVCYLYCDPASSLARRK